ncbi:MAG: DHA2 family efflux MFS transporter permease subunit [Thermodesulfobacterium sp.]|nr:DHA2 family efflux MFS transporter permease subunit [Thermodesulfobacterium sp.]
MRSAEFYHQVSTFERITITITLMIGHFMAILNTTVVNTIMPKLLGPLSTDLYGVQWVGISYMISAAIALLFVESFSRYVGYALCYTTGLVLFVVFSAFCGFAQSLPQMIIFRSFQGIGEAFIMATAQTILLNVYPPERRGTAMGIYSLGVSFAPALGPTVGGFLTEYISWRWAFYINVPIGILDLVAAISFLPFALGRRKEFSFNFISYGFISLATIFLLISVSKGQQYGWFQSTLIVSFLILSLTFYSLYFASELVSKKPLIDFKIYTIPEFGLAMAFQFFILGFVMYQVFYLIPLYYQNLKGLTTFQAGLHMLSYASFVGIFSIISGRLSDKIPPEAILFVNFLILSITTIFLLPKLNYYTPALKAAILTIPLGIAIGCFFAPLTTLALRNLGEKTGLGVVLFHYQRFVGGSIGIAIATNTLEKRTNYHFLRITELQEFRYVNMLVEKWWYMTQKYFSEAYALKKAKALLYKAEYIQALSFAFQDTFRETFVWTQIGGIFLIVLIFYKLKRLTFNGFFYNSNKKNF